MRGALLELVACLSPDELSLRTEAAGGTVGHVRLLPRPASGAAVARSRIPRSRADGGVRSKRFCCVFLAERRTVVVA